MKNNNSNVLERDLGTSLGESRQVHMEHLFTNAEGREDISRRGEFVKHFNLGGSRRQAIQYAQPVHYRDKSGAWMEIDNTLEESVNAQGRRVLRNRSNSIEMEFPCEADGGSMAAITCGGKTFSWRFEREVKPVAARQRSGEELRQERLVERAAKLPKFVGRTMESLRSANLAAEIETAQERRMEIPRLHAENRYDEVLPGVSVRYELMGNALKEDIILADSEALDRAAIRLPNEYDYAVSDAQELQVLDRRSGEVLFTMDTPLVYDAAGREVNGSIRLTDCAGYTRMEYIIDPEFLEEAAWPVTIDPVIRYAKKREQIEDAGLSRGSPDVVMSGKSDYYCGNRGAHEYITLVRFKELVKQKASDTIVAAMVGMHPTESLDVTEYMACYPVVKAWNPTASTWNNMVPDTTEFISDEVISYVDTTGSNCYFDITNLYRSWYQKDRNFGVAFRYPLGVNGEKHYVKWAGANRNSENGPCMVVNYLSHAGLESWWEYESMGAGRVGTAHVDLFNGNLVFEHADVASSGSRMPVTVTHYYNSCLALTDEQGCGLGWRTSANQSLYKTSMPDANWNTVSYYVWTDGDGTEHYFPVKGSSPYKDEETQMLKLTVSGSTVTIRSKDDTAMLFPLPSDATKRYITSITDACGNVASFNYDSNGLLTSIADGAGRATTFTYASGMLTRIEAPDQQDVSFEYVNQRLTKIVHSNLGTVVLSYDESGLLQEAGNADGSLGGVGVRIGYQDVNAYDASAIYGIESCKVTSLMQTGIENCGAMLCFDYLTSMTKVRSLKSGNASAAEGKTISYQFNVNGNLVCAFDELGYARRADFDDYNAEKLSSRMQKAVVNLAKNLAFSSDPAFAGDWIYARVPAADTVVQDSAARCLSMPSLKIVKTGAGETFARQTVQANKTGKYTFSAYIKTEGLTGGGAFLRVKSGSTIVTSAVVQGSTDSASCGPAAEGWERVYVSVDSSAGDITLELVCGASGGTAHFACPQLEEGEIANRVNLLTNGDFARTVINAENTTADRLFPADWTPAAGISTDTSNCVLIKDHNMPAFLSGNALQMVSFPASANVGFNQEVPVSGAKGDVFVIGGWVSSHSVYSGSDQSAPCIAYRFTNGSTDGAWQYANFNREWVGWQFGAWAIAAPTAYTKVTFSVNYARNAQTAMFSNMFMYREQFGQSFDYDSNKNLISVENLAGQKSEMKYDSYDNLTSYVQPGAPTTEKYTLTYGSTAADQKKHLVQSSSTPEGVDQQFQYDTYGNLTQSKTVDGTNAVIGTKTEYALNSNYPFKTYDARGNAVTRSINGSDYTLTSVTDPAGQAVTYAYDAAKRVTGVQTQADGRTYRNSYKYEKDRIETVAHNTTGDACDVVYRFNYDGLGRKTSVQVGNATSQTKTLSTNKYSEDRSGLLTEVEYGNSTEAKPQKVKYFYDDFDRLTGVAYDSEETPRYTYAYDASGEVAKVTDKHLNRTIETERDLAFRPRQSTLKDAGGNTLYRTTLYYDGRNRLEKFAERAGSADYATAYAYDKDSRTTEISFSETSNGETSNKLTYAYDALGRVQTRTATVGSNNYTTTYDYTAGNTALYGAGATTPLVASITQGSGTNGMNFVYTYDTRGNIISETRNGLVTHYVYDALGQLIQVDDPHEQATWKYYYDRGGNITRKDQYVWPAGATSAPSSLGSPTKTINYGYNDANWKDKLTSYDGKTITYDAIGNPLNDGVRTYTWGAGRQLRHISMLTGETHGFRASNGVHEDSNTVLRIVHDAANSKLKAKLLRDGRDVTDECAASTFVWTKGGSAAGTGKEIAVTDAEVNGDVQFGCTYTETQGVYGTVSVNNSLVASHDPATADANHVFSLLNGMLKVEIPNSAGNGTDYRLADGVLSVNPGFTGTLTAEYAFTTTPTREIDFEYDHNGLRTQKKVVENGITTIYDYTLHGKLITHLTKRTVDENGTENTEELHFFYDAQNKPAFVEFDGAMYRYVHNLQGDIVAIVDAAGNFVVEYKYDAWGKPTSTTGSLKTSLGELNPFRYRGYVWNAESSLYYLKSRYYCVILTRFVNADGQVTDPNRITDDNLFAYCSNNPIIRIDPTGKAWWHWVVGAAIVVACAAAVVVTAGGTMAGVAAVSAVANGMAATSTAATIASGAFIGSSIVYGAEVITAASESTSIEDFNQRGNWNTIFSTAGGAALGAANGYYLAKNSKIVYRSRGSTGRKTPLNLREQLGMKQVQSNPLAGARRLPVPMTDPRWPAKEGWVKMANNVNGIEIHFVYNPIRGYFDDFKFK